MNNYEDELRLAITNYNRRLKAAAKRYNKPQFLAEKLNFRKMDISSMETSHITTYITYLNSIRGEKLKPAVYKGKIYTREKVINLENEDRIVREEQQKEAERRVNARARNLWSQVEAKAAVVGRFPDQDSIFVKELGLTEGSNKERYEKLIKYLDSERGYASSETYRTNYLKSLLVNVGITDINAASSEIYRKVAEIYNIVAALPIQNFLMGTMVYKGELDIPFLYVDIQSTEKLDRVLSLWEDVRTWEPVQWQQ